MLEKLKNKLSQLAEKVETFTVDEQTQQERIDICDACEHKLMNTCTRCGCFIPAKTKLSSSSCPKNKWMAVKLVKDRNELPD